jgi:hypothetical protein
MLKGIDPLLTPELLMHLCAMGHGEWVAVVDANFTADFLSQGKPVVRIPGHSLERVSRAVLSVFPLAVDVAPMATELPRNKRWWTWWWRRVSNPRMSSLLSAMLFTTKSRLPA